ncbi:RimK/LysX family protein [Chromatocurvus halotolerans]|uniref:Putative ATP-dependent zinc protease n=1 Tax=Chromatocurvus halotolerans TaxID=1132028 RepID=A0A4R2K8G6_9GAMM|nr:RimK/LysX family protein [Chromatocurvus halotolerans]TCO69661.1 putative ATP-dependent zinc protease [Chromatocurvus halotolerans]
MIKTLLAHIAMLIGLCGPASVFADTEATRFGWVEFIEIQPWGIKTKAKLDSGALTSAMHAVDLAEFQRDDDNIGR